MSTLVHFPQCASRRYEVFTIEDNSLCKIGVMRGEDFVVACGEFYPGDFHALEVGQNIKVLRMCERPPNLIGRILPPHERRSVSAPALAGEFQILWKADAGGNVIEVDRNVVRGAYGVEPEAVYGFGFLQLVAPEDRARIAATWGAAMLRGGVYQATATLIRADSSRVEVNVVAVPHADASGKVIEWVGLAQPGEVFKVA